MTDEQRLKGIREQARRVTSAMLDAATVDEDGKCVTYIYELGTGKRVAQMTDLYDVALAQLFANAKSYIDFLLSLVDSKVAEESDESDDGSAEWCDDCHGYTHKYDCPSKHHETKTPVVDQIVGAVYRSMAQYEDGTWWLDNLKAKARVKRLFNKIDAAALAAAKEIVEKTKCDEYRGGPHRTIMAADAVAAIIERHFLAPVVTKEAGKQ